MNSTIRCTHYKKATGEFLYSTKMKGSVAVRGIRRNIVGHRAVLNVRVNEVVTSQYMLQSCRTGSFMGAKIAPYNTDRITFLDRLCIGQTRYYTTVFHDCL